MRVGLGEHDHARGAWGPFVKEMGTHVFALFLLLELGGGLGSFVGIGRGLRARGLAFGVPVTTRMRHDCKANAADSSFHG